MVYLTIDTANLFHRAKHGIKGDIDLKLGMCFHVIFNAVKKCWVDFDADHCVFAFEGHSWRKDYYEPYKRNRLIVRELMNNKEKDDEALFFEAFNDFKSFLVEKTNATVLQHDMLEGDDLIAGFIRAHPNDTHIIISTDSDFHQLISNNVSQYNGVEEQLITIDGYFDVKGNPIKDKKTGEHKLLEKPEWILFKKCIRGDSSDNVFSAYPGVRTKGTKNKIGIMEAFEDRHDKGYAFNNFMLQRWVDIDGNEHKVLDDYNRNVILIDLAAQPDNIKTVIHDTIVANSEPKEVSQVGVRMMKFCKSYDLRRILDNIQSYSAPFQARYEKNNNI